MLLHQPEPNQASLKAISRIEPHLTGTGELRRNLATGDSHPLGSLEPGGSLGGLGD